MSEAGLVVDEPEVGVVRILLDRPDRANAMDLAMVRRLRDAVAGAGTPAIVLGSTRARTFSAGADLAIPDAERAAVSEALYDLVETMLTVPSVIVAAAAGHVVGGGSQILLACDVRIGSPETTVRFVGPGHGLAVGVWGLPSLVGRGAAMDLCLTSRTVGADEALRMGLLDRVEVDASAAALRMASLVAGLEGEAAARAKRVVVEGTSLLAALAVERAANRGWHGAVPRPEGF